MLVIILNFMHPNYGAQTIRNNQKMKKEKKEAEKLKKKDAHRNE